MKMKINTMTKTYAIMLMILLICMGVSLTFVSCTISVTTLHTQGKAEDVIDETQAPNTQVNPNVTIPAISK